MTAGMVAHLRREAEQRRVEAARHVPGTTGREIAEMDAVDAVDRVEALGEVA